MEPERIAWSSRERERLKVLHEVEEGHLKQVEAARRLRLSDRQVRRNHWNWVRAPNSPGPESWRGERASETFLLGRPYGTEPEKKS